MINYINAKWINVIKQLYSSTTEKNKNWEMDDEKIYT